MSNKLQTILNKAKRSNFLSVRSRNCSTQPILPCSVQF